LDSQRTLQHAPGNNHAHTLVGVEHIPYDNPVRKVLDPLLCGQGYVESVTLGKSMCVSVHISWVFGHPVLKVIIKACRMSCFRQSAAHLSSNFYEDHSHLRGLQYIFRQMRLAGYFAVCSRQISPGQPCQLT
jgi:hypothetical protein